MRKRRERNRARRTAQTPSERQATTQLTQLESTREHKRTSTETPEVGETRLKELCPQYCQETDRAGDHPTVYNSIYS